MSKIAVNISSSRPIFIEADADNFGRLFADMSDEDQVHVLRAMVEHMKPHQIQWDYISIALEKEENRDVRDRLSSLLPDIAAKDAEITRLREAMEMALPYVEKAKDENPSLGDILTHALLLSALQPKTASMLEWDGFDSRSSLGDLYSVSRLSENVCVTYKNGTAFPSWKSTIEEAKAAAQSDFERVLASAKENADAL